MDANFAILLYDGIRQIEGGGTLYKLLVVEDEDLIRDAIVSGIDWAAAGFLVRGAEDGEAALKIVRSFEPDIVLTDIRMPFIDGLELTRILRREFPDTIVVILSGHDEFSYAQEALSLGVKEYIQKPITPDALIRSVRALGQELDVRHSSQYRERRLREQLRQSLPSLRERVLNSIVHNLIKPAEIEAMLDLTDLRLRGQGYTVCLIEPEPDEALSGEADVLLSMSIGQIIERELGDDGVTFLSSTGRRVLIYAARTQEVERPYVFALLRDINDAIGAEHGIVCTTAIGTRVKTLSELYISYESAKSALEQRIFDGRGKIYDAYDLSAPQDYYPFDQLQSLLAQFRSLPAGDFKDVLDGFFTELRQMRALSGTNLLALMLDLVNGGHRQLLAAGGGDDGKLPDVYDKLFSIGTLDEYQTTVTRFFIALHEKLEAQRRSKGSLLIEKICSHINDHFADSALSLNTVASAVYISPTYLSILFKKEMGCTFVDYISRLRMEKAKELLRDSQLKTYEAAERTGYNDPQYFSSCFKKYTGMTPSEYKARQKDGRA